MNSKLESKIKLIALFVILFCSVEVSFSDYKKSNLHVDEAIEEGRILELDYFQGTFYYFVSTLEGYYMTLRGAIRFMAILTIGYRDYYVFSLHRQVNGKVDNALIMFTLSLVLVNFIYDVSDDGVSRNEGDAIEINTENIIQLPALKLDSLDSLEENSTLYNILKPLRDFGVNSITFLPSQIDNEIHLLGRLTLSNRKEQVFFDIIFCNLNIDRYYWVEFCCNRNANCNIFGADPVSVLSEEVINELSIFIDEKSSFMVSVVDFKKVKGVDYSVNEKLTVVKIRQSKSGDKNTYVMCDTNANRVKLKSNNLNFSNQTLALELKEELFIESDDWMAYLLKIIFKQIEHSSFLEISHTFFKRMLLGECGICRDLMTSVSISLADCNRHYFCSLCLTQWKLQGSGRCPYCRS